LFGTRRITIKRRKKKKNQEKRKINKINIKKEMNSVA